MIGHPHQISKPFQWPSRSTPQPLQTTAHNIYQADRSSQVHYFNQSSEISQEDSLRVSSKSDSRSPANVPVDLNVSKSLRPSPNERLSGQSRKIKSNIHRNLNMRQGSNCITLPPIRADSKNRVSFRNQRHKLDRTESKGGKSGFDSQDLLKFIHGKSPKISEPRLVFNIFKNRTELGSMLSFKEKYKMPDKSKNSISVKSLLQFANMLLESFKIQFCLS